jgi:protein involved in polysaccharide export with SLBB domain
MTTTISLVLFSLSFTAQAQQNSNPNQKPVEKTITPPSQKTDNKAPEAPDAKIQVFHAGDALLITTFPDTAAFFRGVHRIDDQGFVDFPALGKIQVLDKSEKELSDMLIAAYVNYMRYPILQIHPLIRVSLLGGFYRPGLYWVPPTSSLWDVINIAGGTTREDGIKLLKWERSKMLIKPDLVEDFQSGNSLKQIGFNSGDQLWVTPRPKITALEYFQVNIFPLLSITISMASTSIMAYQYWTLAHPKK